MTSMFGLVLAIGIVVDDAIVVVEAVQHNHRRRHERRAMRPSKRWTKCRDRWSRSPAILAAVFIPVAFLGGISGQIYRQFALTIAASVLISAFSALSLSPALTAMLLRPKRESEDLLGAPSSDFNLAFDWTTESIFGRRDGFGSPLRSGVGWACRCSLCWRASCSRLCPPASCRMRIRACSSPRCVCRTALRWSARRLVTNRVEDILRQTPGVQDVTTFGGLDILTSTQNSNVATVIATLKPWEDRKSKELQFESILGQGTGADLVRSRRHSSLDSVCRRFSGWELPAVLSSCWRIAPAATTFTSSPTSRSQINGGDAEAS